MSTGLKMEHALWRLLWVVLLLWMASIENVTFTIAAATMLVVSVMDEGIDRIESGAR